MACNARSLVDTRNAWRCAITKSLVDTTTAAQGDGDNGGRGVGRVINKILTRGKYLIHFSIAPYLREKITCGNY